MWYDIVLVADARQLELHSTLTAKDQIHAGLICMSRRIPRKCKCYFDEPPQHENGAQMVVDLVLRSLHATPLWKNQKQKDSHLAMFHQTHRVRRMHFCVQQRRDDLWGLAVVVT